jgi:hypothetical protein
MHPFPATHTYPSTKLISDDLEQSEIKWVSPAEAKQPLRGGRVAISRSALALALEIIAAE